MSWLEKEIRNFFCPLLSNTEATISQLYDVYKEKNWLGKKFMGVNRSTFLIDKDDVIRKIWHKVNPEDHAGEVLGEVDALKL